jgi:hypothetical protein
MYHGATEALCSGLIETASKGSYRTHKGDGTMR